MAIPVILDVDTGIDDALAIALALRMPELKVEAITTVFGNVSVEKATDNTLQILELCGRPEIPVYKGAHRSLMNPYVARTNSVHGPNGLGGVVLPEPKIQMQTQHAVDYLIEVAKARPGEMTLVPVGRLTNVALALIQAPEIATLFKEIVIMGGAVTVSGNSTPTSEANIMGDPEAARVVFRSGTNIRLVGLDVTMKTLLTPSQQQELAASADPVARTLAQMLAHYLDAYQTMYAGRELEGCAMHDPLAVAVVASPDLVKAVPMHVDIECEGSLTRGMTVGDRRGSVFGQPANCNVCLEVDSDRFINLLMERLGA